MEHLNLLTHIEQEDTRSQPDEARYPSPSITVLDGCAIQNGFPYPIPPASVARANPFPEFISIHGLKEMNPERMFAL